MTSVHFVIQSLEDAKNGKPILKNSPPATEYRELGDVTVGILEGGMQSGKTALMFLSRDKHGEVYYFEMSAKNFEMLNGAVEGAMARFGDKP